MRDVSGVGIALRGAPATTVFQNTVVARDRDMLVGISLVANPAHREASAELGGVFIRCVLDFSLSTSSLELTSRSLSLAVATGSTPHRP